MIYQMLLPLLALASNDCVNIVPGKSLGLLAIGKAPPAERVGSHAIEREKASPNWLKAGPYLIQVGSNGKIDSLQYDPGEAQGCYSFKGKPLPKNPNLKALRKAFPSCVEEEVNFGSSWVLNCDGMTWLSGAYSKPSGNSAPRVIVKNQTLRQREEEKAGNHVKWILQSEWPYRSSHRK